MTNEEIGQAALALRQNDAAWMKWQRQSTIRLHARNAVYMIALLATTLVGIFPPERPFNLHALNLSAAIAIGCGISRATGWFLAAAAILWLLWMVPIEGKYALYMIDTGLGWLAIPGIAMGYHPPLWKRRIIDSIVSKVSSSEILRPRRSKSKNT